MHIYMQGIQYLLQRLRNLAQDEEGANLVEYLVLLAVVTIAVIGGITIFASAIANAFSSWGIWLAGHTGPPP